MNIPVEQALQSLCQHYQIVSKLGEGSFGVVYEGQVNSDNRVALKCINLDILINFEKNVAFKEYKKKLLESQYSTMMMCNSPNVIKCYRLLQSNRWRILVLEFCEGGCLYDLIEKKKRIPEAECRRIFSELMMGFAVLHENKIIHRDIKTQNILIHQGVYKIGDFGLAKKVEELSKEIQGTILGSQSTMAPEVRDGEKYSYQADLWSLGVIYYEMLYGQLPYHRNINEESIDKALLKLQAQEVSQESHSLLRKIFVINPDKRLRWSQLNRMRQQRQGIFKDLPWENWKSESEMISRIVDDYKQRQRIQNPLPVIPVHQVSKGSPWSVIQAKLKKHNQIIRDLLDKIITPMREIIQKYILPIQSLRKYRQFMANFWVLNILIFCQINQIVDMNAYHLKSNYYNVYQPEEEVYIFNELVEYSKNMNEIILKQELENSILAHFGKEQLMKLQDNYFTYNCKTEEHVRKAKEIAQKMAESVRVWKIDASIARDLLEILELKDYMTQTLY